MTREKYEISIWEDVFVPYTPSAPEHYEDQKVAVIGSNTLTAACHAYEPKLVQNVNGTNTFTFKMYYVYTDETTGEKHDNPFLDLLVNERKIKVFWKDEWYDLVIKNVQKDSNNKSIIYTCKDLFINELSKNGFNLEFDNELGNNLDTIDVLAERILEGSDWKLDRSKSDVIRQEVDEALYLGKTSRNLAVTDEYTNIDYEIPVNSTVLLFYSQVVNQKNGYCQFLYYPGTNNNNVDKWPHDNNSFLIIDVPCCSLDSVVWKNGKPDFLNTIGQFPLDNHRGKRLVKTQKTIFDNRLNRYVDVYKKTGTNQLIYGYDATEYRDPTFVNNLIVNNSNFAGTEGWLNTGTWCLYPEFTSSTSAANYTAASYLFFPWYGSGVTKIYNAALKESGSYIPKGIQKGESFIFRFITRANDVSANRPKNQYHHATVSLKPHIYEYDVNTMLPISGATDYIRSTVIRYGSSTDDLTQPYWIEYKCDCQKSFSRSEVYEKHIGLFVEQLNNNGCWVEQIEFFPFVKDSNGTRIDPGNMDKESVATVYHYYYNPNLAANRTEINQYEYVSENDAMSGITPVFNDNPFTKMRSITGKQSNRFNLLQQLAETFQCWCVFNIEHYKEGNSENQTPGKIIYDGNSPRKTIYFKTDIGEETGVGFVYGIDLKTISRTIQSDQIVTKTIVSPNNNEFATDGFCTIARSTNNYIRDNFILNFDYYIQQGLLDSAQLQRDLYNWFTWSESDGHEGGGSTVKGYYTQLRELNNTYDDITEKLTNRETELLKFKAYQEVYSSNISSLQMEINLLENEICSYAHGTTFNSTVVNQYIASHKDMPEIVDRLNALQNCRNNLKNYQVALNNLNRSIENLEDYIERFTHNQELYINSIKELNYQFYKRYSRFIQEGSWIDEDYTNDDLYYFDAQNIAYTSSRPQVNYNISVARLSSLEEFQDKIFNLGDIAFIQDPEFFGYVWIDGVKTPVREKVLISEVTSNFDSPEQDSFRVQNYKTQFEDLFQRITATTQSLQYAAGEYARAANAVTTTGEIKFDTLQNSISNNNRLVIQSNHEQIYQDSTGITVTDATNPNKRTKLTSGGIFISTDGGANWKSAVHGEGIATQYLTSGTINTNYINISDGQFPTFRWDSRGLNAYSYNVNSGNTAVTETDFSRGIRFDRFGIYGLDGVAEDVSTFYPTSETEVWEKSPFGLTWKGFFLRHKDGNHMVEITSTDDIRIMVKDDDKSDWAFAHERVKLGRLDTNNYGLRLRDEHDNITLETESNGTLWLKDQLNISTTQYSDYNIRIGYLPLVTLEEDKIYYNDTLLDRTNIHRAIDVNQKMVVWEDGTLYAKDGYFEGTINAHDGYFEGTINAHDGQFTGIINATGGHIGTMSINEFTDMFNYHVEILTSDGSILKNNTGSTTLIAELYFGLDKVEKGQFSYQWFKNQTLLSGKTSKTLTVLGHDLTQELVTYSCQITYVEP